MAIPLDLDDGTPDDESMLRAAEAFDKGLGFVRQVQRAYYAAAPIPVRLVAREALPPIVPHALRRLRDDDGSPLTFQAPVVMYLPNQNVPTSPDVWDDRLNQRFDTAMERYITDGFLFSHLDFLREVNVALYRDGAHRSAIIFAATACQILFDDTLAHLLWEDGKRPEEAAAEFDRRDSVAKQVKSAFAARTASGEQGSRPSRRLPGLSQAWAASESGPSA
jgi:hypothetical protein